MTLTPSQLVTLKNNILADPVLAAQPMNGDGHFAIKTAYNLLAVPNFTVWKSRVSISDVGKKINGAELGGLTTANHTRLQTIALYLADGVNPSLADNRAFFDDVFSGAGGTVTRATLLVLWKRLATRAEKLFAVGTGSDAAPATMTFEGLLTVAHVESAREG